MPLSRRLSIALPDLGLAAAFLYAFLVPGAAEHVGRELGWPWPVYEVGGLLFAFMIWVGSPQLHRVDAAEGDTAGTRRARGMLLMWVAVPVLIVAAIVAGLKGPEAAVAACVFMLNRASGPLLAPIDPKRRVGQATTMLGVAGISFVVAALVAMLARSADAPGPQYMALGAVYYALWAGIEVTTPKWLGVPVAPAEPAASS